MLVSLTYLATIKYYYNNQIGKRIL